MTIANKKASKISSEQQTFGHDPSDMGTILTYLYGVQAGFASTTMDPSFLSFLV